MNHAPGSSPNRTRTTIAGLALVVPTLVLSNLSWMIPVSVAEPASSSGTASSPPGEDLKVEVTKKGLGKEVSIRKGNKEWFMLIEVTPENTVVVRQEKENETYLLDESETHDRPMTTGEVDVAIEDFINSVKAQVKRK